MQFLSLGCASPRHREQYGWQTAKILRCIIFCNGLYCTFTICTVRFCLFDHAVGGSHIYILGGINFVAHRLRAPIRRDRAIKIEYKVISE